MNSQRRLSVWIGLGLVVMTIAAYWQVSTCDFVTFDDHLYVTQNSLVLGGLTLGGCREALTSMREFNWHPLTWLSLMTDKQLFGLNPTAFHLVNLAIHLCSVLLLFMALLQMTSEPWRSGLVAALFAVHPIHVESVAWISERKDVLCAFFGMLTLVVYSAYVCKPIWPRYLLVLLPFALGLMSKSMLVTLPCVLLLLDFWPLRRILRPLNDPSPLTIWNALCEKLPMLLMSVGTSYLTIRAQNHAIDSAIQYVSNTASERIWNAIVSYVVYLQKTFVPVGLCCFYPYGVNDWPFAGKLFCAGLLIAITLFAVKSVRHSPALLVGWLWYLGTLVPVIGLIQVGEQSMADRYTYLPLIGIFIMIAWSLPDLKGRPWKVGVVGVLAATGLLLLVWRCQQQVVTWRSTYTLFRQAYLVNPRNWRAAFFLAEEARENGQINTAVKYYREAASDLPRNDSFQGICGSGLMKLGRFAEAADCFSAALKINSEFADHHRHLGLALIGLGQLDAAAAQFREAIRLRPDDPAAHSNLGAVLLDLGKNDQAEHEIHEALRLNPHDEAARKNVERLQLPAGKLPEP